MTNQEKNKVFFVEFHSGSPHLARFSIKEETKKLYRVADFERLLGRPWLGKEVSKERCFDTERDAVA